VHTSCISLLFPICEGVSDQEDSCLLKILRRDVYMGISMEQGAGRGEEVGTRVWAMVFG